MAWKEIIGKKFSREEFKRYVAGLIWGSWRPEFIVLHHTAVPSLTMRPQGISDAQIESWVRWYRDNNKWSAGPHLFVDDHRIWVFTPLTTPGVHAKNWNARTLGMEMLGNFDIEPFNYGRGALVRDNAVAAIAILTEALGLNPNSMKGHRDYPGETKTCPGRNVNRAVFIEAVKDYLTTGKLGESITPSLPLSNPVPATRLLKLTVPMMIGADVQKVLTVLQQLGYYGGKLDSTYGPMAEAAVCAFQEANGLGCDGKVGPQTLAALQK